MIDVATRADDVKADGAALQRSPGLTIGVDIGGTKVAAGVVDPQDTILATTKRDTPADDPHQTAGVIVDATASSPPTTPRSPQGSVVAS